MVTVNDDAGTQDVTAQRRRLRRVVLSSYLGSTFEFYDFLLYASATALVFGPVFFSGMSPQAATLASVATFTSGYLARPLGGVLFGHFGDRMGRKTTLIVSMTVMGVATILIGAIPPPSVLGSWSAVILVILRLCQGIAVGGEWGGAVLMALEHAENSTRRAFYAAFANAGAPSGSVLGSLAMAAVALLPREQFLGWGWRIPFLLSAVLLVIGLFIRTRVTESPVFEAALVQRRNEAKQKPPILEILRKPKPVILTALGCMASFSVNAIFATVGISYAVEAGVSRSFALLAYGICMFIEIFTVLAFARLADRIGRRRVLLGGMTGLAVLSYPVFVMLGSGSSLLVLLAFILLFPLCHGSNYGPTAAFIAEQFGTSSRYTGASLGYQLASLLGGGITPLIVAATTAAHSGPAAPALPVVAFAIVSLIALLAIRETKGTDLRAAPQS